MKDHDELLAKIIRYKELIRESSEKHGLSDTKLYEAYELKEYISRNIISALIDGYELTRKD